MTTVTREMIAAAHDVTMRHKIVLGHELLTEIYQAMNTKKGFVGLTDEEVDECYYWKGRQWTTDELVRHVEAKLREKNNG